LNSAVAVIARAAGAASQVERFEVPLAYQTPAMDERYHIGITRGGHFLATTRGLLPNRSISSRLFITTKLSRLQSHCVAK
jgi:hypothetical protein